MLKTSRSAIFGWFAILAVAGSVGIAARAADTPDKPTDVKDPCVQAAVQRTTEDFPLNQATERAFYIRDTAQSGKWKTFTDLVNMGIDPASPKYIASDKFDQKIEKSYASKSNFDAPRKKRIREEIVQGKEILSLEFKFDGGRRLLRHYVVVRKVSPTRCIVQHTDAKLDELTGV